jgi:hypothetical protein
VVLYCDGGQGTVFLLYGLTDYFQNHRQYILSRDDLQLVGRIIPPEKLKKSCWPRMVNGKGIAPCGMVANSKFNGIRLRVCGEFYCKLDVREIIATSLVQR